MKRGHLTSRNLGPKVHISKLQRFYWEEPDEQWSDCYKNIWHPNFPVCALLMMSNQGKVSCMNPPHEILLSGLWCDVLHSSEFANYQICRTGARPPHLISSLDASCCLVSIRRQWTLWTDTDLTIFQTQVWSQAVNTHFVILSSVKVIVMSTLYRKSAEVSLMTWIVLISKLFMFNDWIFCLLGRQSFYIDI